MLEGIAPHPSPGCLSDLALDELRAEELSQGDRARCEQHLDKCADCRTRQAALDHAAARFLEHFPMDCREQNSPTLAAQPLHPKRAEVGRFRAASWVRGGLAMVAASVLYFQFSGSSNPEADVGERSKGSARLGFFVKRGQRVFEGSGGTRVQPGDRLRFQVTTAAAAHIAVLSLDAAGFASVYHPQTPSAQPTAPVRGAALPESIELDETLGEERVWGLFCRDPFEVEKVRKALEVSSALPPLPGCAIDALSLRKEPRR